MLLCNYKPTCSYSFTVSLSLRNERPRRTLRYQWQFDHRELGPLSNHGQMPCPFSRHQSPATTHSSSARLSAG
jgi:hypothetical protein